MKFILLTAWYVVLISSSVFLTFYVVGEIYDYIEKIGL